MGELSLVQMLEDAAKSMAGMELRLPRCQWRRIQRQGQGMAELRPTPQCTKLQEMQETPVGTCMKVVGAYVGSDLAEFGRIWLRFGRGLAEVRFGRGLAKVGRGLAKFGRGLAEFG